VTNPNNDGFFGSVPLVGLTPGQTFIRGWWNVSMFYLDTDVNIYPVGSSLLRAGIVWDVVDLEPLETPTPISNPDADWVAITSINPYSVQLSRATNVAWQINWGFPIDLSIKSQRRNDSEANMVLYAAWEMALEDEVSGFTMNGWWASLDALVRTPA